MSFLRNTIADENIRYYKEIYLPERYSISTDLKDSIQQAIKFTLEPQNIFFNDIVPVHTLYANTSQRGSEPELKFPVTFRNSLYQKPVNFRKFSDKQPRIFGDIQYKENFFTNIKRKGQRKFNLIKRFNLFKNWQLRPCLSLFKCNTADETPFPTTNVFPRCDRRKVKNKHCSQEKSPELTMINNENVRKMAFPIEKESENLLFVASKYGNKALIGPPFPSDKYKKCCVIDLDETLIHSSFKELPQYDFKVRVEIEGIYYDIFIVKRPFVDDFLNRVGQLFECVLFTASLAKYANLVTDKLDRRNIFRWRLFRESCVYYRGGFVKDLSMLGRPIDQIVIIDNSPISFLFNIKNAVHVITWFNDPTDRALIDLIPYCEKIANSDSVIKFLQHEPPPLSSAWPIKEQAGSIHHVTPMMKTADTLQLKNLNPITNFSPETDTTIQNWLTMKNISSSSRQSYTDKIKVQPIPPIRSFLGKETSNRESIDITDKRSSTYSSRQRSGQSRISNASLSSGNKDSSVRSSIKPPAPTLVAFNSSIKQ